MMKRPAPTTGVEQASTGRALLSQETLRTLLRYEPETGRLYWRERPLSMFSDANAAKAWNVRYAGKEALSALDSYGYRRGAIWGQSYRAHRVIFKWMTGEDPDQVDHINGIRDDNRWRNLRSVTQVENSRNARMPDRNTSGTVGVSWHVRTKRWRARIKVHQRYIHLGNFPSKDLAIAARKAAERKYNFHPNHGRAQ